LPRRGSGEKLAATAGQLSGELLRPQLRQPLAHAGITAAADRSLEHKRVEASVLALPIGDVRRGAEMLPVGRVVTVGGAQIRLLEREIEG
jgi:hypothetical protein